MLIKFSLKLLLSAFLFSFLAFSASATEISVTNVTDPDNTTGNCATGGNCSLRQSINAANPGDTITFNIPAASCPAGVCTINLLLGPFLINKNLTISGTGARKLIVRRNEATVGLGFNIFNVFAAAPIVVNISGMTISHGTTMGGGGGIYNGDNSTLTLSGVAVTDNAGQGGGGILNNNATLTIINSLVANNGGGGGGGIGNYGGTVTIANSTISGNEGGIAGGILNGTDPNIPATLNLNNVTVSANEYTGKAFSGVGGVKNIHTVNTRNTIISGNIADDVGSEDIGGTFVSQGNNLVYNLAGGNGFGFPGSNDIVGQSGYLTFLGNFGGQTNMHGLYFMLPFGVSPALNAGNSCVVTAACGVNNPPVPLLFDQRGAAFTRNFGATIDIGAYEFQPDPVPAAEGVIRGRVFAQSGGGLGKARVTLTDGNGAVQTAITNPFGYFQFENIQTGQTVTLTVGSKSFQYMPQVFSVANPTDDLNFVPQ